MTRLTHLSLKPAEELVGGARAEEGVVVGAGLFAALGRGHGRHGFFPPGQLGTLR